ncbi:unnamed protein product [Aspergillus oryzae var. brunneus]|uniref:Unnamed protein product n=1 Tax=Aspergillus oryzae var. brunneus TaxID=332754 RepID=A0ABQ6KXA0_ASPOZ|nr:unnamed protein product [Aspergillus oryzae var. brunneus]
MTAESSNLDHTLPSRPTPSKSAAVANNEESKLTALEKAELALADKYSSPDVYIDREKDTCWHPWLNNLELKPLRFESRTGTFVVVLRSLEDTWLGKHRHRGSVTAVTLKGEWNYKEYISRLPELVCAQPSKLRYQASQEDHNKRIIYNKIRISKNATNTSKEITPHAAMAKTLGKGPTSARLPIKKYSPYPHSIDSRLRYYAPRLGISAIIAIMRTWTGKCMNYNTRSPGFDMVVT